MKKVLVTGGAGFIGSHTVVELIHSGFTPVILDNFSNSDRRVIDGLAGILGKAPEVIEGDCTHDATMREVFATHGPFEGVIHFAAFKAVNESVNHPLKYYHNNLRSTENLLRSMHENGCDKLVFSSSCTVYGQPDQLPVTEETPFQQAHSPYGFTKQICERMITDVSRAPEGRLNSVLLRYFNPIGAHPSGLIGELPLGKPENLVPYITQTAAGLRDEVVIFGDDYATADGTCIRDYIHVMDLAQAHVSALNYLANPEHSCEAINLGTGCGNSVREVVETFQEVTGVALPHRYGPRRAGDVEQIYASAAKAADLLNWQTKLTLADALKDAWNWQQKLAQ
jgi:UDP-glucose 4-epimerase